ncbi:recombination regulator RecX [Mammaliicoccus sciuri]|uniref:recombination regulator RecX n=1 Tax=Mammaliicoccus sciuri TaxID=1296 RepID=UPI00066D32C6|nr:recombination regulator RecX [Mammaliicoccus sciuri]MEB6097314.1 recombination regulator RecX [Mammaliicoccus sciuri]MEB6207560.1 recombination regulator RecX [Mammaliicoccus sciuri]MEB6289085.1 recombination regulator RecX [Mammaliicoccus sciuri]MEB7732440.1 recombination regulator RecX [Mammaliicoccus sciuri]MEB7840770.1 recombination regulator RecX [Mammaliicoccus sciuri]
MLKITKLEVQKKNKERLNLFINNEFEMGIDQATYINFNLRKDLEITKSKLQEIKDYDQYRQALNQAIVYLSHKKRTKYEVEKYLTDKEYGSDLIDSVIEYCESNKYIDHKDYIESLKNTILKTTDKGPDHFERVAKEKGIEQDLVYEFKEKFEMEMAEDRIPNIAKKIMQKKKQPPNRLKQTIVQTLQQRGYAFSLINEHLTDLNIEPTSDDVENILMKDLEKVYNKYQKKYNGYELKSHVIQALVRKGYTFEMINDKLVESGIVDE